MSFKNIIKSKGPKTEPCGTPHSMLRYDELNSLKLTNWVLLER